jgi:hypothetical protein
LVDDTFILTLVTGLGVGGIVGAYFSERFRRQTQAQFAEFEEKATRFRTVLVYMQVLLYPEQIEHLPIDVLKMYNLKERKDIEDTLFAEYSRMVLFAPDAVLKTVKKFMEHPDDTNYWKTATEMRKALWGKKTDLSLDGLMLTKHHPQ